VEITTEIAPKILIKFIQTSVQIWNELVTELNVKFALSNCCFNKKFRR